MCRIFESSKVFLIVVSLFIVFVSCSYGQSQIVNSKGNAYSWVELNKMTPYMKLNDDYTVYFDRTTAEKDNISPKLLRLGADYEQYHNNLIKIVKTDGIYSQKAKELPNRQKFANLFISSTSNLQTTADDLACGGSQQKPHPCPPRKNSGYYKNTLTELSNYLKNAGFHNTYWPGCGNGNYNCATDFTRWVNAYSCTWGSFRMQASAFTSGSKWTYWTQSPEPNPEIFSYSWPVWWWGTYVQWWHTNYC